MGRDFTVMGIVNVTPDSFSDGGRYLAAERAIHHSLELEAQGADILDIGGESTRPGAEPVSVAEELRRVMPVIEGVAGAGTRDRRARMSIDTSKAPVAAAALRAGADIVNDVTALRADPALAEVIAASGADVCLMHMLGEPRIMQRDPRYDDVVADVKAFLEARMAYAVGQGIAEQRILLDPGIGFGKTLEHNLELVRRLPELVALGRPIVVGASRKSFLGRLTGRAVDDRESATVAINVLAFERGASVFRVHDVAGTADGLAVAAATVRRPWPKTTTATTSSTT